MSHLEEPAGRKLEVATGIASIAIALLFVVFFIKIALNIGFFGAVIFGGIFLLPAAYWFGLISFKLLFGVKNKSGGLISTVGLKILCVLFGLPSLVSIPILIYVKNWAGLIVCGYVFYGCYRTWQLASKRGNA